MKKLFLSIGSLFFSCLFLLISAFPVSAAGISVSAKAAVVICAESGEVVYSKNMDTKLSMASTTKIMTALLALEYGASDEMITVTDEMVAVEGTSMGLIVGDSVSLKTLVKGMLLESGNDAANAAAYIIGGSIENFVQMMNQKAQEIGMKSTSFETPSGLDGENHYSTAYDMALLTAYALKNPEFRQICSAEEMVVYYGSPPYRRVLSNHNKLLDMYEGAYGVKTGFTKKSGRCLVSAAERDGKNLIAVTLSAPDDWNDHIKMFDYCFERVTACELNADLSTVFLKVTGGTSDSIGVEMSEELSYTVLNGINIRPKIYIKPFEYAPVYKGEVVGWIEFYDESDTLLGRTSLVAGESVQTAVIKNSSGNSEEKNLLEKIKDFFR